MTSPISLTDWLKHIESFHPNEIELGLERIDAVAEKLSIKSFSAKIVIVGGTNGKGSCVAVLEALALTSGLKVGVYTSPHLVRFNERIRLNASDIDDELLVKAFTQIERARGDVALTFFEFTTLAAFWVYQQCSLDLVVLEVGLGGRLDAVNIVEPDVSVITTIALDHMDWLGSNLSDIAKEKAGILRCDKPGFIGDTASFKLIVESLKIGFDRIELVKPADPLQKELIENRSINRFRLLEQNVMASVRAFEYLYPCEKIDLAKSLKNIHFSGRFQQLPMPVPTIVDVAHNPQAACNLNAQIANYCKSNGNIRVIAICGMMADKAIEEVLQTLDPVVDQWNFVDLQYGRAISAAGLQSRYLKIGLLTPVYCYDSVAEAYRSCSAAASSNDLILVFGSFITVAKMLQYTQ